MTRRKADSEDELDPARSSRDEFYPKGRKGGVVVRLQTDYSRGGRLLRYSLALIDTHRTGVDGGRVLGCHNTHGHNCDGKIETVELESNESIEKRFEAEVRAYLESRKG